MLESDGTLLLNWLRLLGWLVAVDNDGGDGWIGVAQHDDPVRGSFRIEASAPTRGEIAWQLFEGAVSHLDRERVLQAA
jgi:hypothetical protein